MMPRDVTTRWDSTYDMLEFAVTYHDALDNITTDRDMKLRQFELSEEGWVLTTHLCDALKVHMQIQPFHMLINMKITDV